MKKVITVLISLLMILSLAACGNSASQTGQPSTEEKPVAGTVNSEEPVENSTDAENTATSEGQTNEPENPDIPEEQGTKVLVAYFSATNTTQGIAEHIADGLSADIYEIVPEEPYTDADLNYNDNNSRTTIEMNDPDARPAISGSVEDMEQYDIVFIGYPIWWGEAPRIVSTFVENYDFSGKTIVPFCTSGGSGVGSSATNLEQLTDGADWLPGKRLNGNDSQDTVMEWVNGLGLDFGE
ncbi:MAG: flavodoxin [Lachnospiraceae bacterium]|nr:flavodoxin [Lachnospiraceae bacterium]